MKANPLINIVFSMKGTVLLMILSAVLDGICGLLLIPVILTWQHDPAPALWQLGIATVITLLVQYIALQRGFFAGSNLMHRLTKALVSHIPRRLSRDNHAQGLLSGAVMQAMGIPAHLLAPLVGTIVMPLTIITGLLFYHPGLAALFAATALILIAALRLSAVRLNRAETQLISARTDAAQALGDFARHQALLRKSEQLSDTAQQLEQTLSAQQQSQVQVLRRSLPYHLLFSLLIQLLFIVVLVWGALQVSGGTVALSGWLAVMVLIARFIEPLHQLSHIDQALRQAGAALNAINRELSGKTRHSPEQSRGPSSLTITADNLSLVSEEGKQLLHNVSFVCPENRLTVITGSSGAGKTTLLHLLARTADPQSGVVNYGDMPVTMLSETALASVRQLVTQSSHLLRGTLRWSLLQGATQPDDNAVIAQLYALGLTITAAQLDEDTGEQGDRFSGGQKQRLCLARALLAQPSVLLLDEPTASLDVLSRKRVIDTLTEWAGIRIIVTHSPELARRADHVIVMAEGQICAQGSPADVAAQSDWFARFCTGQTENSGN
ncbi:ATP-binding cassette domain-containing protein [Morganella psychrotolerans]|uniref:ATP-binding cassette domain-containing protein n=1 Tax=Morganella psychrotolerans TaxID=368603 RepID=UPI0039AF3D04